MHLVIVIRRTDFNTNPPCITTKRPGCQTALKARRNKKCVQWMVETVKKKRKYSRSIAVSLNFAITSDFSPYIPPDHL